jgi:hypothetical protein
MGGPATCRVADIAVAECSKARSSVDMDRFEGDRNPAGASLRLVETPTRIDKTFVYEHPFISRIAE